VSGSGSSRAIPRRRTSPRDSKVMDWLRLFSFDPRGCSYHLTCILRLLLNSILVISVTMAPSLLRGIVSETQSDVK
jgi:hypothetical protein